MTLPSLLHYLAANWLEYSGVATTLLGIWLTTKRLLVCWPVVLLSDLLYLVVFYQARLYSDTLLQIFFLAFTLYGWWYWWRGVRQDGEVRIVPQSRRSIYGGIVLAAAGSILWGFWMQHLHAALPFLDATLMIYSLLASWWGVRKYISNWWLWIVVDLIYVGEYLYKGLAPTAALYLALIYLAALGVRDWRRAAHVAPAHP